MLTVSTADPTPFHTKDPTCRNTSSLQPSMKQTSEDATSTDADTNVFTTELPTKQLETPDLSISTISDTSHPDSGFLEDSGESAVFIVDQTVEQASKTKEEYGSRCQKREEDTGDWGLGSWEFEEGNRRCSLEVIREERDESGNTSSSSSISDNSHSSISSLSESFPPCWSDNTTHSEEDELSPPARWNPPAATSRRKISFPRGEPPLSSQLGMVNCNGVGAEFTHSILRTVEKDSVSWKCKIRLLELLAMCKDKSMTHTQVRLHLNSQITSSEVFR